MSKQSWIWGGLLAPLVAGSAWWFLYYGTAEPERGGVVLAAPQQARLNGTAPFETVAPFDPTRLLQVSLAGELVIDDKTALALQQLVGLTTGDRPAMDVRAVERSMQTLPRAAAARAIDLFARYRSYIDALKKDVSAQREPQTLAEAEGLLARRAALRRQHFDRAALQQLFTKQDAEERLEIEALFIERNPRLSTEEKRRRIEALQRKAQAQVSSQR